MYSNQQPMTAALGILLPHPHPPQEDGGDHCCQSGPALAHCGDCEEDLAFG